MSPLDWRNLDAEKPWLDNRTSTLLKMAVTKNWELQNQADAIKELLPKLKPEKSEEVADYAYENRELLINADSYAAEMCAQAILVLAKWWSKKQADDTRDGRTRYLP